MKTLALLCLALIGCVGEEFTVEPPWVDGGSATVDAGAAETQLTAPLLDAAPNTDPTVDGGMPQPDIAVNADASRAEADANEADANDAAGDEAVCVVANCRCFPVEQMPCCKTDETCGCITVIPAGDGACQ